MYTLLPDTVRLRTVKSNIGRDTVRLRTVKSNIGRLCFVRKKIYQRLRFFRYLNNI